MRTAHQPPRQCSGVLASAAGHGSGNDSRVIAPGALAYPFRAARKVGDCFGREQTDVVDIDDVEVRPHSRRDMAAIAQTDCGCGSRRQRLDCALQRHHTVAIALAGAPACPARKHMGRQAGIAEQPAMRAAIAKTQHAGGMGQHLPDRRHAVAGIVRGRNVNDAVGFDEDIVK